MRTLLVLACLTTTYRSGAAPRRDYDVVIGGTPTGVAAAIAAACPDKTVIVIEEVPGLGVVSLGLRSDSWQCSSHREPEAPVHPSANDKDS